MRKAGRTGETVCFFCGKVDGRVILKGFEGMFAHPLNGLKELEASIFHSTHFRGKAQEE